MEKEKATMENIQKGVPKQVWGSFFFFLRVVLSRNERMSNLKAKILTSMCTLGEFEL